MPASLRHLANADKLAESVLAKWPDDNLFYKVDVLSCNKIAKTCRVRFEDDFECSMAARELHAQLDTTKIRDELIVCCVCDDGTSKMPNEIIMCDVCQQGYHVNCHDPPIDRERANLDDDLVEWQCETCKLVIAQSYSLPTPKKARHQRSASFSAQTTPKARKKPIRQAKSARKPDTTLKSKPRNKVTDCAKKQTDSPVTCEDQAELISQHILVEKTIEVETSATVEKPAQASDTSENGKVDIINNNSGPCDLRKFKKEEPLIKLKPNQLSMVQEKLQDGSVVEEMQPIISGTAKKLAEMDSDISTKDFVNLMVSEDKTLKEDKKTDEKKFKIKSRLPKTKAVAY